MFRDVVPGSEAKKLRAELGELARALGKVRDWDVLIEETLAPLCAANAEIELLIDRARAARGQAQAGLCAWLDGPRFARLHLALGHFATASWRAQPLDPHSARLFAPARDGVGAALAGCQRRIERASHRAKQLTPAEIRRLRLRVKEARYCAELAEPLLGKRARRYARRAAKVQDALGEATDAAVARARIAALEMGDSSAPLQRAAGFAHGWIARGADSRRRAISARVKKLRRAALG